MIDPQVNFFSSTLVGTYSDTDTSLTIATGSGEGLPDPSVDGEFNLVIYNESEIGVVTTYDGGSTDTREDLAGTNPEIVRVTARSGDVLTVTRGQEGTTASVKEEGNTYRVILSATKKIFDDIQTAIDNVDLTTLTGVEELTFDSTGDEEFGLPAGTTAQRPASPSAGYMRFNTDTKKLEVHTGGFWGLVSLDNVLEMQTAQLSVTANDAVFEEVATFFGNRGLFGGGDTRSGSPSDSDVIDYVAIDTTGNAQDFGDLTVAREHLASCSSGTRGLFGGGRVSGSAVNTIDFVTIATTGNATDFGDLSVTRRLLASCSDGSRGLFGGGLNSSDSDVIDYVTIDTTGNAQDFGDLTQARRVLASCSDGTRGVFGGGDTDPRVNTIDYVTIATTGNAQDFGDLTVARDGLASCSGGGRGLFGGGNTGSNFSDVIDYVTIATTGNATDFGDLTASVAGVTSCSNDTRGLFAGGNVSGVVNTIEFVTIDTTGNATDFGDLTVARETFASCSGD